MKAIVKGFMLSAAFYGVVGILLGLHMAMSHDHAQMPTHAHIMVIGWLSFFVFGLFYGLYEETVSPLLARIHFWSAQTAFAGLVAGLGFLYGDRPEYEPLAAISALVYAASFLLFTLIVFRALRKAD